MYPTRNVGSLTKGHKKKKKGKAEKVSSALQP
jgi:hypothetical protein